MSRYKDVDKILEAMDTWPKYGCNPDGRFLELTKETEADYVPYVHYDDMVQAVTGTPVQDVAPVVHAHWEEIAPGGGKLYFRCSNCSTTFAPSHGLVYKYCFYCGAKMDEVVNDG